MGNLRRPNPAADGQVADASDSCKCHAMSVGVRQSRPGAARIAGNAVPKRSAGRASPPRETALRRDSACWFGRSRTYEIVEPCQAPAADRPGAEGPAERETPSSEGGARFRPPIPCNHGPGGNHRGHAALMSRIRRSRSSTDGGRPASSKRPLVPSPRTIVSIDRPGRHGCRVETSLSVPATLPGRAALPRISGLFRGAARSWPRSCYGHVADDGTAVAALVGDAGHQLAAADAHAGSASAQERRR